jgi:hypothetical protein
VTFYTTINFNAVLEALQELEAAETPLEAERAARKVATTATALRNQVKNAVNLGASWA